MSSENPSQSGGTATVEPKRNGRAPRAGARPVRQQTRSGLAQALAAVQAQAPKLRKDREAQIQNRVYGYATLDGVLDDIHPLLVEHELLWTTRTTVGEDGDPAALYRMEHIPSGEYDEWTGPLPCSNPQDPRALGSAITYMRRYTLVAYLNLAPGEDDDGAAAATAVQGDPAAAPHGQRTGGSGEKRFASERQAKLIHIRAKKANLGAVALADLVLRATGSEPREWEGEGEATGWLERALKHLPQGHVDPVLHAIDAEAVAR